MTTNNKRLIEIEFPLKQTSLDSVHEKNVRHGHISTLHIWPARRPLAASRAALIATLLPDPGDAEKRKEILERMAGRVTEKVEKRRVNGRQVEKVKEETVGGILHWGRENGPDLQWFRDEIRKAYGGRAPKVLDPFAGGGAIPLEAMRLGCEVTAMDINPVAWFILKCTLEYPQKLAGQTRPLPKFALRDGEFMESFLKAKGFKGASLRTMLERLGHGEGETQLNYLSQENPVFEADLAWQVRAWGRWVLARARKQLASYYPTYAEYVPLASDGEDSSPPPMQLLEVDAEGVVQIDPLNAAFDADYLKNPHNPRWVAKPTVAYLWARTVTCKQCRATLPLLKTRWLCKKERKRVLLTMEPDADGTGVVYGVESDVPRVGGNAAQRREHDRRAGGGTMSRTGATCPCCGVIMTMEDVRLEGRAGRLDAVMTAVVVNGPKGKEYRLPTEHERHVAEVAEEQLKALYTEIPYGLPEEPTPTQTQFSGVYNYGFDTWRKLFTNRQLLALGTLVLSIRQLSQELNEWPVRWSEALIANLALVLDRLADYSSAICSWHNGREVLGHTFARFALPIIWDYTEVNPLSDSSGNFLGALDWVSRFGSHAIKSAESAEAPCVQSSSATRVAGEYDVILTDPPYYDAIPYSDLMDFFHVWLRRSTRGLSEEIDAAFSEPLGPKWNHEARDGELIDDASRFDGDKAKSKTNYEDGMARAFGACHAVLQPEGRLVVVFANKHPDAWETLVGALIRGGFVVDGSWPIQTEMGTRTRAMASAALSSSVWIVCKRRKPARPWLGQQRSAGDAGEYYPETARLLGRRHTRAGLRVGGDGTCPGGVQQVPGGQEGQRSRYQLMNVSEFLREVRRMVVDFVVGRVLSRDGEEAVTGLDDVTTYYLLHRNDFGLDDAPVGGCILYALSCNLSDTALVNQHDLLAKGRQRGAGEAVEQDGSEEEGEETGSGGGAKVKLKPWNRRTGRNLGVEGPGGRPVPLIDQVHKLMQLWRGGDQGKVNGYIDERGLQRNALFAQILQALIELADAGSDERSILEALSNHVKARDHVRPTRQGRLGF